VHGQCSLQTTCCIISPHTTVIFLNFYDPCKRLLYKAVVQDPPSWAVSLRPYVLSLASIASSSHTHGTLVPPPRYGRAYTLFSRLLKEPHMSYFHPCWSHSCCCLRWKRVKISSILVNFRGQHVVPIPSFSCACP
jgi:hypothetical protein